MKRSAMIEIIQDTLLDITGNSWSEERCNEILFSIEAAGMMPPENGAEFEEFFTGEDSFCSRVPIYKWEPEEKPDKYRMVRVYPKLPCETNPDLHEFEYFDAYYECCKLCGTFK